MITNDRCIENKQLHVLSYGVGTSPPLWPFHPPQATKSEWALLGSSLFTGTLTSCANTHRVLLN